MTLVAYSLQHGFARGGRLRQRAVPRPSRRSVADGWNYVGPTKDFSRPYGCFTAVSGASNWSEKEGVHFVHTLGLRRVMPIGQRVERENGRSKEPGRSLCLSFY
jgi:hypothetical protein